MDAIDSGGPSERYAKLLKFDYLAREALTLRRNTAIGTLLTPGLLGGAAITGMGETLRHCQRRTCHTT